jgi:predicted PurR-regulated permease PerM
MGHFIFIILHFAMVLFGVVGLVITIPLHLIYSAVKGNRPQTVKVKKTARPKGFELGRL